MEEKFVKFTEGESIYLTKNKPYRLLYWDDSIGKVKTDSGVIGLIRFDSCVHIQGNDWYFCDENGTLL